MRHTEQRIDAVTSNPAVVSAVEAEIAPLAVVPDNQVYLTPDSANTFVADFLRFSQGRVVEGARSADGGEIGSPGETIRRIRLASGFGNMLIFVSDGHPPYPFGREVTGYPVANLEETIAKAQASGATLLTSPYATERRRSVMRQFPGGYIAELHAQISR